MTRIETRTARVYVGGGRRFFTKKAAIKAAARKLVKHHCYCYAGNYEDGFSHDECHYHDNSEKARVRWWRLVRKLYALHGLHDSQVNENASWRPEIEKIELFT